MPNGVRHVIGALVGLISLPGLYYGLEVGPARLARAVTIFQMAEAYVPAAGLAGCGVLIALLTSWQWLSPLAALLSGAPLCAIGVLWVLEPVLAFELSQRLALPGYTAFAGGTGLYLLIGSALLITALFPSRWRSRRRRAPAHAPAAFPAAPAAPETAGSLFQPQPRPQPAQPQPRPQPAPGESAQPAGSLFQPQHPQPPVDEGAQPTIPGPLPKRTPPDQS
ncbi:hypothetical protein Misp01_62630 [Microtetraspora sp. NBRC 13810]|uniref:hypothetical protein n=1 Tax=Microtetraspora sp. NBRC 13810 TaxID=3030990 RepID=UPI0024A0C59D|nr:hypothetical protein [Microtetraspora sp. NBRC 13810]GLW11135.1 hypothetical protein Misp01_62630 [Microtetraspora sp. NBRC 13810]